MKRKFVILTHARTGSTWLVDTLNNIEGVTSHGELFLNRATMDDFGNSKMPRFLLWKKDKSGTRPFLTYRYLNGIFNNKAISGFKLMYLHLARYPEISTFMAFRRVAVIHLLRKNLLESVLSSLVAKERGKFHYRKPEIIPEEKPIKVDPQFLVKRIKSTEMKNNMTRSLLKRTLVRHIEVYYEDLLAGTESFRPIWDFLGVDFEKHPPTWQLKKARSKTPKQTILNYEEAHAALSKAGYDHFLY